MLAAFICKLPRVSWLWYTVYMRLLCMTLLLCSCTQWVVRGTLQGGKENERGRLA